MLTVKGLNGRVKALYGAFEPAQKTQGGCQCAQLWSYKDANDQTVYVKGQCVNPGGAHAHPWCQYEPESCTGSKYMRLGTSMCWSTCAWPEWLHQQRQLLCVVSRVCVTLCRTC